MSAIDSWFRSEVFDIRIEIMNRGVLPVLALLGWGGMFLGMSYPPAEGVHWVDVMASAGVFALSFACMSLRWAGHSRLALSLCAWGALALAIAYFCMSTEQKNFLWVGFACAIVLVLAGVTAGCVAVGLGLGSTSWCILAHVTGFDSTGFLAIFELAATVGALVYLVYLLSDALFRTLRWTREGYETAHQRTDELSEKSAQLELAMKSLRQTGFALARANEQLELMVKYAEDARRAKQDFAAKICHELRAPLNLIIGFSDILLDAAEYSEKQGRNSISPDMLSDVHAIWRSARHLLNLSNDILDLSQMDMNYMTIVREPVNVGEFIRSSLADLVQLIQQHGLRLILDIEPSLPDVYADRTRVRQVLLNLVNNALRFTNAGSITIRAWVQKSSSQTPVAPRSPSSTSGIAEDREPIAASELEIVISVTDTGVGIRAAELRRIFEPFVQLESPGQGKRGGSGLGLTISKQFVELHGGRMWAESTPGQGSSFYFTLPFVPPMLVAAVTSTSREIHRREVGGLAVVERSPVLSRILERQLDGIKVARYDSTEELVRLVEQSASACPEAVLINEPLNVEPLPAQWPEVLRHAPILRYYMPSMAEQQGVQGVGEHPDHEAVMVDHYLSKPFTREQLNGAIDQLLVSSRKRDPETPIDGQTGSAFPARILVVEDDDDTSFLIDRMLRAETTPDRRSVTTIEARNGAQAIEIMLSMVAAEGPDKKSSKDTIDGVLLDIQLGDITGFDVLSEMSRHESLRRIPVCLMSGYAPYTGDGPLITPYLTLTRYDGIAAKDAVEAIVHLLHVALPGINATLSPNAVSQ